MNAIMLYLLWDKDHRKNLNIHIKLLNNFVFGEILIFHSSWTDKAFNNTVANHVKLSKLKLNISMHTSQIKAIEENKNI